MVDPARHEAKHGSVVLLGRRSDLLQLQALADLPGRFLAVYEGGLEQTADDGSGGGLEALWNEHVVVGLDAELLMQQPRDGAGESRYRDNLGQKLASRRVVMLVVLRDCDADVGTAAFQLVRRGEAGGAQVACRLASDTLADLRRGLAEAGYTLTVDEDEANDRACLLVAAMDETPLLAARDLGGGALAEILDLQVDLHGESSRLRSRWFSLAPARNNAKVAAILADCARRQEHEALGRMATAWRDTVSRMQADTRARTQLELVVVATRPFDEADRGLVQRFEEHGRTWLMTDRLRVGGDHRTLVRSRHVWHDAVGMLLARLALAEEGPGARGTFAWRGFVCGISHDAAQIERMRATHTMRILEGEGATETEPRIEKKGPFEPLQGQPPLEAAAPEAVDWQAGGAESRVDAAAAEQRWVGDHRRLGDALGRERMKLSRATGDAVGQDPELVYSQAYWTRVQRSPAQLRTFGTARLFRDDDNSLAEKVAEHLREWREDVLAARRKLARDREDVRQCAEELDVARRFHVGVGWRLAIGSAVAAYAGFLALNVLRVLLTFSSGTWLTGAIIFVAALCGGWVGALLPAWVERSRGTAASRDLSRRLNGLHDDHLTAAGETYEVFQDAEGLRQSIRIAAIHRRTTLLAERAWYLVVQARDEVAREFERRKLLTGAAVGTGGLERLAGEDLRDWRNAAIVRPEFRLDEDLPDGEEFGRRLQPVVDDFLGQWKSRLEREDPYCTGLMRAAVLRGLVRDLATSVGACIEELLLRHAQQNSELVGSPLQPSAWTEPIVAAVGLDAANHAMLSVLDEGSSQRVKGSYRTYCKDFDLARQVVGGLRSARQGLADVEPVPVSHLPLGGFAMVFHEVSLRWQGGGLVLDDSEFHAPEFGGDTQGASS